MTLDRKNRNVLLAELQSEAWHHAIAGQKLLSRIRNLEAVFWAEDARADKKAKENDQSPA
jgi:hypothetical protein